MLDIVANVIDLVLLLSHLTDGETAQTIIKLSSHTTSQWQRQNSNAGSWASELGHLTSKSCCSPERKPLV